MSRVVLFLLCFFSLKLSLGYEIKGKLNISEQWQPVLYLASIDTPDKFFVASPEFKINSAQLAADGTFTLSGDDLPDDPHFYRLYLVQNSFSAVEFYHSPVRNFMHLILGNNDKITLSNSDPNNIFTTISFVGSEKNERLCGFETEFYQKKELLDNGGTKAKRNFISQSLNKYIHDFIGTCNDPLIALFALYHIDDKETDFLRNSNLYFNLQEQIGKAYPKSSYSTFYNEQLNSLTEYRKVVCEIPELSSPWKDWVIALQTLIILVLAFFIFREHRKKTMVKNQTQLLSFLSEKELSILEKLSQGKANKEIASELFVELSTIKTHLNNIYKKLGVNNRQDAVDIYNQQIIAQRMKD